MPATTMTAGDLRRALTTALAGAELERDPLHGAL